MNKNSLIFIAAVIILVVVLIFITGKYPPPAAEESGGTIGKVEKYRKIQMTAKDVILRSEVISDTSRLAQSIYGLMVFNAFAKEYAEDLKEIAGNMKQCQLTEKESMAISDYSTFIEINRKNVENMIALLNDFYVNDTTDFSVDIDEKLIEFDSFVRTMVIRDSLLTGIISSSEKKIKVNSKSIDEEIIKLKNIHDQLLVKKLQLALVLNNTDELKVCSESGLYNVQNLGIFATGNLNVASKEQLQENILNNKNLSVCFNKEKLNNAIAANNFGSATLGTLFNKGVFSFASKEKLGFILDKPLGCIAVQQLGEQVAAVANSYIGIVIPNTVNSKELQNVLSLSISNQAIQQKILGSTAISNSIGLL